MFNRKDAYRIICRITERSSADIVHGPSFNNDYARIFLKGGSFSRSASTGIGGS